MLDMDKWEKDKLDKRLRNNKKSQKYTRDYLSSSINSKEIE